MKNYLNKSMLLLSFFALSCGGGGGDDEPVIPKVDTPEAAVLLTPIKDAECNEGTSVSSTLSKVKFEWSASKFTTKYTVVVKNLNTNASVESNATTTSTTFNLEKGVPYEWNVISKNATTTTATSETWKFYNAGDGVTNYTPFPAEVVSPAIGSITTTLVTLKWKGSDVDNDIDKYEVFLDTKNPPTQSQSITTNSSIENIVLTKNTVYYLSLIHI